ncbi:hypothetical protein C0993_011472 [Termitomyces sp. T159_Od127]|nr:hypothetical protein C0993_011472 [Termitomyces sp. T159_Od127]
MLRTKRKNSEYVEENTTRSKTKRMKANISDDAQALENTQPTNRVLPVTITFPQKTPGTLRIATWNICGLSASLKKGFKYYVEAEDADIMVLTETKVNNEPVDPTLAKLYPYRYWSIAEKKGYAGTAILSKHKPLNVNMILPGHPDPSETKGRIIMLEFEAFCLIGTYVVNAGHGLKTLGSKKVWNTHFDSYIRELDRKKPVIWTGDLNVAPTEMGENSVAN